MPPFKREEQPPDFLHWVARMREAEKETRPSERVYLVLSTLRPVMHARGKSGGVGDMATSFFAPSTASLASFAPSRASHNFSQHQMAARRPAWDRYADDSDASSSANSSHEGPSEDKHDLARASDRANFVQDLKQALSHVRDVLKYSDCPEDDKPRVRKRSYDRKAKTSRFSSPEYSPAGSIHGEGPAKGWTTANLFEQGVSYITGTSRTNSMNFDEPGRPSGYDAFDARKGKPDSFFEASKTAEQHWAVEVRGRYYELKITKKPYGDAVREFSEFTSHNRVKRRDREVTAKIFVGTTHMVDEVLHAIGKGIMKTQPEYGLRSDNCQHFMAVYLPRILCARHDFMRELPNASVCLVFDSLKIPVKTTTFPVYEIGIRSGTLSVVRHEYLRTYNGIRNVLSQLRGEGQEEADSKFTSLEVSQYVFQLQSDNERAFDHCNPLYNNPYLLIHRHFERKEIKPLGTLEAKEDIYHLWAHDSGTGTSKLVRSLKNEHVVETMKKSVKLFKRWMLDKQLEMDLRERISREEQ